MDRSKIFRKNIISTEGTLKYYEKISLQNIALINIVKNLWMNEKSNFIKGYHYNLVFGQHAGWRDIEDSVLTNIKRLILPKTVVDRLVNLVEFVGNEIRNWIGFHVYNIFKAGKHVGCRSTEYDLTNLFIHYMDYVKWANNGKIDVKETAIILLTKTELQDEQKFVMSSIYCLEEELNNVPTAVINKYSHAFLHNKMDIDKYPMIYYWTYHRINQPSNLYNLIIGYHMPIDDYVLDEISDLFADMYDIASEYFWDKLTDVQKLEKFVTFMRNGVSAFKYSLLSTVNYEQQKMFFQSKFALRFLMDMFCDWNFADCFLPTVYHIFDILNPDQVVSLFDCLSSEINFLENNDRFCKVECYILIFRTLWENTPVQFQEYVLHNGSKSVLKLL